MEFTPGFRFYPTEEELVAFYLHHKLDGKREDLIRAMDRVIPLLHVYGFNPWDLPQLSGEVCRGDPEQWFFFKPSQENEKNGGKASRQNTSGYWKTTGSPCYIYSSSDNRCIGLKRTMVFYNGRSAQNGSQKTDWKLNEYKAIIQSGDHASSSSSSTYSNPMFRQELTLCRVYKTPKCRRSFDRRPIGIFDLTRLEENEEEEEEKARANPPLMEDITDTQDNGSQSIEDDHININMATQTKINNNEPMWDWEHLYSWDYM